MKKYLLLASVAALAFTSCSDQSTEFVGDEVAQKAREIAFAPVSRPVTRGQYSIIGTAFPADNTMQVRAYKSLPTPAADYFAQTTFSKDGTSEKWEGDQYWPLSASTINFFAVSSFDVDNTDITIASALASATVDYTATAGYDETTQSDIMYAFGRGAVTQGTNDLTFPVVPLEFKHALALIDFEVKAKTATEASAIKVNSITLNGATYNGSLTLTNTGAAAPTGTPTTVVAWTPGSPVASYAVPGISSATSISTTMSRIGQGLMVIPTTGFTSFTINYSLNGSSFDYTYTPASAVTTTAAATKYTYQIEFTLHEIQITPTISNWTVDSTSVDVPPTA